MTTTILADEAENGNGTQPKTLFDLLHAPSVKNDPATWPRFEDVCRLFRFEDFLARELCAMTTAEEASGFRVRPDMARELAEVIIRHSREWRLLTGFLEDDDAEHSPLEYEHTTIIDRAGQTAPGFPVGSCVTFIRRNYAEKDSDTIYPGEMAVVLTDHSGLGVACAGEEKRTVSHAVGSVMAVALPDDNLHR